MPKSYHEEHLKNGFAIITSENPYSDIVTISTWVKVGARDESADIEGYSHLLEHMLFRGTKTRPSAFAVSVEMDRVGAASNAFTGSERIYFLIQVARAHFDEMLALLADVIMNPLFDEKTLENEKKVVIQELQETLDNPTRQTWTKLLQVAFGEHPLSHIPIGNKEVISRATPESLRKHYEKFFFPSNAALIVCGGIDDKSAMEAAEKYFGGWENTGRQAERPVEPKEMIFPVNTNGHIAVRETASKQSYIALGFLSSRPDLTTIASAELLQSYLGYGHTSLLYQELRHKRGLAYSVFVSNQFFQDANLFSIETRTDDPKGSIAVLIDTLRTWEERYSPELFSDLKKQWTAIFTRSTENSLAEMRFLGEQWVVSNRMIDPQAMLSAVNDISYELFLEASKRILDWNNTFISLSGPDGIISEVDIKEMTRSRG